MIIFIIVIKSLSEFSLDEKQFLYIELISNFVDFIIKKIIYILNILMIILVPLRIRLDYFQEGPAI